MKTEKPASDAIYYYVLPEEDDGEEGLIIVGEREGEILFSESVGVSGVTQAQVSARALIKQRGFDPNLAVWVEDPENDPRVRNLRDEKREIDPRLVDPKRLAQRRIAGEHLCVFCAHDVVCELAAVTRRNALLGVVIAGCAAFDHAG